MKWFHNKIEQNWRQLMWQSCVAWSERLWNNNHPWFGRSWLTGVHFFRRMAYCFPTSMGGANPENKWSKQVDTGPQYPSTGLRSRVTWPSISGSSHTQFPLTYHVVTASANTPSRTGTPPCPEEKGLPMLCQKAEHVSDLPEKDLNHQSKRRTQVNVPFST